MKNSFIIILGALLFWINANTFAQSEAEKLDLPGDNLNLYAVLKLFQESETLEGFERKLNEEDSEINNLDLDGDDQTDYIRVEDNVDGNLHTITLKVAVSEREDQDVAVFYVEKKEDGQVWIQLIGDEDLYGKDYIIEPNSQSGTAGETPNPGYSGNREAQSAPAEQNVTYVSSWPVVQYIFVPQYVIWRSPWRWHYYPSYWRPWRPRFWHYYYGYHYHWHYYYNGHFRRWPSYRNPVWHTHYYGGNFRSRSVVVQTRYTRGDYRRTYSNPSSAQQGSALFVKRYPKAPTTRERLPSFDRSGRPQVTRPATGRPGTSRPSTDRPVNGDRQDNGRPAVTRPEIERPTPPEAERPARPNIERPTRPEAERPARPNIERPVRPEAERPARPEAERPARPNIERPTRPETERPARPNIERQTRPDVERPAPSTHPTASPRPETSRPTTQPSSRQPAAPRSSGESDRSSRTPRPQGN